MIHVAHVMLQRAQIRALAFLSKPFPAYVLQRSVNVMYDDNSIATP